MTPHDPDQHQPPASSADERLSAELEPRAELYLPHPALPHEHGDLVPPMAPAEYVSLRGHIDRHGIPVALEITASGAVLERRQRLRAARELGSEQIPVPVVKVEDEPEYIVKAALRGSRPVRSLSPYPQSDLVPTSSPPRPDGVVSTSSPRPRSIDEEGDEDSAGGGPDT